MALDLKEVRVEESPGTVPSENVTVRAIALGLLLVVALDILAIYFRYVVHGSLMTYSHIPMAMLIIFTVMVFVGAVLSRTTGIAVSPGEWHTALAMGIVGAAVPGFGLS